MMTPRLLAATNNEDLLRGGYPCFIKPNNAAQAWDF